jgi:hypothetical protein
MGMDSHVACPYVDVEVVKNPSLINSPAKLACEAEKNRPVLL